MAFSRSRRPAHRALRGFLLVVLLLVACSQRASDRSPYSEARARLAETMVTLPQGAGRVVGGFVPKGAAGVERASLREQNRVLTQVRERDLDLMPGDVAIAGLWYGEVSDVLAELEGEAALNPGSADVWSDLAAVYLLRFSQEKQEKVSSDLWRALHAADLALGILPEHPEARFNLALALSGLDLDAAAREAWDAVLDGNPPEAWYRLARDSRNEADQAVRRQEAVQTALQALRQELRQGRPPSKEDFEGAAPFLRSELEDALAPILLAWLGKAGESGAEAGLATFLDLARRVREASGDAFAEESLEGAQAALRRASPAERKRWLRALHDLWQGTEALERRQRKVAEERFLAASLGLDALGSPLRWSAAVKLEDARQAQAFIQSQDAELAAVAGRLAGLRQSLAALPFPGLRARAAWIQARALGNCGRASDAEERIEEARAAFEKLGEPQNEAALVALRLDLLLIQGKPEQFWRNQARLFDEFRKTGTLRWFHNGLLSAMGAARVAGWSSLADRLAEVDLTAVKAVKAVKARGPAFLESQWQAEIVTELLSLKAKGVVEALQAQDEADAPPAPGPSPQKPLKDVALSALKEAEIWLKKLDRTSELRAALACDLDETGDALGRIDPALGRSCPRFVPAGLECKAESSALLRPYVLDWEAQQRRREGQDSKAVELEARALSEILRQSEDPSQGRSQKPSGKRSADRSVDPERSAFLAGHRARLDRLVDWLLQDDHPEPALAWLLAAFEAEASGRGGSAAAAARAGHLRLAPPAGTGVLVLHALPHRISGWLVRDGLGEPLRFSANVERKSLPSLETKLRTELVRGDGTSSEELLALSVSLLAPVAAHLDGLQRLVVVPSPELRALPYAALLLDTTASRPSYLAARLKVSVALPAGPRGRQAGGLNPWAPALFVANPLASGAEGDALSGLNELEGAEKEARQEAERFSPPARLLLGKHATLESVLRELPNVAVAHLATHATWGPKGSGLVLAVPPGQPNGSQFFGASAAERLSLSRVPVVILAACRSARPGGPAVGSQGLVEPLLRVGARSVVASPWPVADALSPEFWPSFYASLRAGESVEEALHRAQLDSLQSGNPQLANPAFWAGFAVYHGDLPLKGE